MQRILLTVALLAGLASASMAVPNAVVIPMTTAPSNGTDEVQTLTFDNNIAGGTFVLQLTGSRNKTASIAWNATTNTLLGNIQTALRAMPQIGADGATVTAGTVSGGHGTVLVTFSGAKTAKLDMPELLVATNALTGTTHALTVSTTTPGVTATGRDSPAGTMVINQLDGSMYWTPTAGPNVNWRKSVNAPTPTPTPP